MGTDKAWLQIEGQPLIKHIIAALAPITTELAIIANDDRYGTLGLAVFPDTESGIGPLEAVRSALTNCRTSRAVLVGCDLPFVTSELFDFLLRLPGEHHAVVPRGPDGKLEPLCAVYWKDLLPIAARLIESGERKVAVLFDNAPTRIVEFDEIRQLRNSQLFFENINTPGDYRRAVHKARDAMAPKDMDRRP